MLVGGSRTLHGLTKTSFHIKEVKNYRGLPPKFEIRTCGTSGTEKRFFVQHGIYCRTTYCSIKTKSCSLRATEFLSECRVLLFFVIGRRNKSIVTFAITLIIFPKSSSFYPLVIRGKRTLPHLDIFSTFIHAAFGREIQWASGK